MIRTIGLLVGLTYLAIAAYLVYSERWDVEKFVVYGYVVGGASLVLISNHAAPTVGSALELSGYIVAGMGGLGGYYYITRWHRGVSRDRN